MLKAVLIDQSPGSTGRYARLEGEPLVLGRAPYADMAFESRFVSRRHARITYEDGGYRIEDLRSANGTFVNGRQVSDGKIVLQPGDAISLAEESVVLRFEVEESTVRLTRGASGGASAGCQRITVDSARRSVFVNGVEVRPPLSRKEFDALELLYRANQNACSMREIAEAAWPERPGANADAREIAQLMRRVRRRLHEADDSPLIQNVRGYGYKLTES